MKAFVTGTNGFIGSHLVELLLRQGHEVTGLVRTTSDLRSLTPLFSRHPGKLRLVVGDLRDPATLGPGLADAEIVFHLAAVLMGTSENEFRDAIFQGTRNLLAAVRRSKEGPGSVPLTRFLHTSSLAAAGPSPTPEPIDETATPNPVSWYGTAKRDTENHIRETGANGLPFTIVRPSAVYGERERDISGSTFPAVQLGIAPRLGFGRKTVSMIYVGDLVAGMVEAARSPAAAGKTFFLTNPRPCSSDDVMAAIADAMGKKTRIRLVTPLFLLRIVASIAELLHVFVRGRPMLTRDKFREISQRNWSCSADSARAVFGWTAATDLVSGMRLAVADWRARVADAKRLAEPASDRAIQTYAISLAFGVVVESIAKLGHWYDFREWWYFWVIVIGVFGGVMGTISYLTARSSAILRFLLGAAVGVGAELLNAFALHAWEFQRFPFGWIGDPILRSLAAGVPAGLMPVLVTLIVRSFDQNRRRVG